MLNIKKASEMIGVSPDTLRNWDRDGKLKSIRTKGNHRRYRMEDLAKMIFHNKDTFEKNNNYNFGNLIKDRTVVYTYVCGDILHKGHLLYLKNAAALGDFLIVGVLTDEAVMEKKSQPIINFEERLELVESLRMVDMVVPQHSYAPYENINNLRPDILMESMSHDDKLIENSKKCMDKINGKVVVSSYYPHQSSTKIKNRIRGISKDEK